MRRELLGYHPVRVDAFLTRCLATPGITGDRFPQLRRHGARGLGVTAQEIRDVRFPVAVVGYRIREVDALLDELAGALEVTTSPAADPLLAAVRAPRRIALVAAGRATPGRAGARR